MKRIAIFCDGTWSGLDTGHPTLVSRLARSVMPVASDGVTQLVYYQPGVGSGQGRSPVTRVFDKWAGGAFGWGVNSNLEEAYRQLIFWYEPGDEIYVFGYSRGAYLARSLVGLIRLAGIPSVQDPEVIRRALRQYRKRNRTYGADNPLNLRFRFGLSPRTATSPRDLLWRRERGDHRSEFLRIRYLGVWDTVGALGLPGLTGRVARLVNRRFAFHDASLSQMVVSARHAVAIDERRILYPPTLWRNIGRLNGTATGMARPYREMWFPGNHGVIGGIGGVPELSAFPAQWVIDGARKLDLHFARAFLDRLRAQARADVTVPQGFDPQGGAYSLLGRFLLADRDLPEAAEDISQAALDRYRRVPGYRPEGLQPVVEQLEPRR